MRRFAPLLVALGLVAAVIVPYLALGGGRFEPTPVADPCEARDRPAAEGLGETIEAIALAAVDGVACELGVSREELVLALRNEDAFDAFSDEHGLDRDEVERAIHDGLVRCGGRRRGVRSAPGVGGSARAPGRGVGAAVAHPRGARAARELPPRLVEVG